MSELHNTIPKPSQEKPWLKNYPPALLQMIHHPMTTLYKYVESRCPGRDVTAISYYGSEIKWDRIFKERDLAAAGLRTLGIGENDQVPAFVQFTPEFFPLLFAIEKIGASLVCRVNDLEEDIEAAAKTHSKIMVAHSYLSQEDWELYKQKTEVERVIIIDPFRSCHKENMPPHSLANLENEYYHGTPINDSCVITWDQLLQMGSEFTGEVDAPEDIYRPMYRTYTSGSTGPSKQVTHCAKTMIDGLIQTNFTRPQPDGHRSTWMHCSIPPAMLAATLSMNLLPMTSDQLVISDPFANEYELAKSFMYYKPNAWSLIPMFLDEIINCEDIHEDTDLSFFKLGGVGAEALNNRQLRRATEFLKAHNSPDRMTVSYGSTESGSAITLPFTASQFFNNDVGVPAPLLTVGIFRFGTDEELGYNEIGEVCKTGAGNMLGYDDPVATAKALKTHSDGMVWLHTGDKGYMDENGSVFILTRGESPRYGGADLMILPMENLVADADIHGIIDEFFVNVPDPEHEGFFLPYLYVVLEQGVSVEDIIDKVNACLEDYQRPVKIISIPKRPFFHYKTNRIGLAREEYAKLTQQ